MSRPCIAAAALALVSLLPPMWSFASGTGASQLPTDTINTASLRRSVAARDSCATTPLPICVGVSYSNAQLNLPWFLNEFIDAINEKRGVSDLLHSIANGL